MAQPPITRKRLLIFIAMLGLLLTAATTVYLLGYSGTLLLHLSSENYIFYWMLLVGALAETVAGSMGMGYGVICTSTLLLLGIPPQVVSSSLHTAESFTAAAGSLSHIKLRNVSRSLVKKLALPAICGAILGAVALTFMGEHYVVFTKTLISFYTLYLGINILSRAFQSRPAVRNARKHIRYTRLGLTGGFIDSFAGGGWGPLVTGTLIKNSVYPRYAVGSSTVAKFVLTLTSAITFFFTLGVHHWNVILGLLIGGITVAPFSALLTTKIPPKTMFLIIGIIIVTMSSFTIVKTLFL